jgi:glutamyl-tRNA synthetase
MWPTPRRRSRDSSLSIQGLREEGIEALTVASYAATIGTSEAVAPHASLGELVQGFDLAKLSRAPARFDPQELRLLNAKLLHGLPFSAMAERLRDMGVGGGEEFWETVRGNLTVLADAEHWWRVIEGPLDPLIENRDLCQKAAKLLPPEPWDGSTWETWSSAIKAATGAKGRALFQPLRLALTGEAHGPELKHLLPLIGRERAMARLEGRTA